MQLMVLVGLRAAADLPTPSSLTPCSWWYWSGCVRLLVSQRHPLSPHAAGGADRVACSCWSPNAILPHPMQLVVLVGLRAAAGLPTPSSPTPCSWWCASV